MTKTYRRKEAGAYPVSMNEVRAAADGLFGDDPPQELLDRLGLDTVLPVSPPVFDPSTQALSEGEPTFSGGFWRQTWQVSQLPALDMPALRSLALATAIAYGNRITQGEISQWAGVEPFSWGLQRDEAVTVRSGGALGPGAVLPELAADKGVTLAAYADDVWANAMRYQAVLKAAVYLRRTATRTLTDEEIDTPAKLQAAVDALTVEADALAAQLLG